MDRHEHPNSAPAVLTKVEAQRGAGSKMSLRVLLFSAVLLAIAGAVLWAVFYGLTPTAA